MNDFPGGNVSKKSLTQEKAFRVEDAAEIFGAILRDYLEMNEFTNRTIPKEWVRWDRETSFEAAADAIREFEPILGCEPEVVSAHLDHLRKFQSLAMEGDQLFQYSVGLVSPCAEGTSGLVLVRRGEIVAAMVQMHHNYQQFNNG